MLIDAVSRKTVNVDRTFLSFFFKKTYTVSPPNSSIAPIQKIQSITHAVQSKSIRFSAQSCISEFIRVRPGHAPVTIHSNPIAQT